jgi:hypothetical protein
MSAEMAGTGRSRPGGSFRRITASLRSKKPARITGDLVAFAAERLESEVEGFTDLLRQLKEARIGLGKYNYEEARRRLQNPRLDTTYVAERHGALVDRRMVRLEELAEFLPQMILAAIELEVVETELAAVEARIEELKAGWLTKEQTSIYPEAAAVVNRLFEERRVHRWHWSRVDDDKLERIASILLAP